MRVFRENGKFGIPNVYVNGVAPEHKPRAPRVDRRVAFPRPGAKTEAIVAMLLDGNAQVTIRKQLNVSAALVSKTRKGCVERGMIPLADNRIIVEFGAIHPDHWLLREIRQEAMARGITDRELVTAIIRTVARDNLFDAVLDTIDAEKN